MRNGIGGFLETLSLEIDAEASVRNDEIRIHRALDAARLFAEGSKSISAMTHSKINKIVGRPKMRLTCYTCGEERIPAVPEAEECY